jgi:PAS domain S-box-containing protein
LPADEPREASVREADALQAAVEARPAGGAHHRTLFDHTSEGILIADPESRIVDANASASRMLGYTHGELIGRRAADIVEPAELAHLGPLLGTIKTDSDYRREWQLRRKDDSLFTADVTATRLPDGNLLGVIRDITTRKRAEEDLRSAEQQLRALVGRLHNVREEEARRIARELHDVLGTHLTALNMELSEMERKIAGLTPPQREHFSRMHAAVDHMIVVVQQISGDLRLAQLDVLGLSAAIDWQAKEFSRRSAISCHIGRLDETKHLTDAQNTAVFRILQESLTNIARHARASAVEIYLEARPDEIVLQIHDNGRGITAAELTDQKSIGLIGMRERAQLVGGEVAITGGCGAGTTVTVRIRIRPTGAPLP